MELINLLGIVVLALLVRKLIWCFRWLWCHYHGRETPAPIPFLPRRTGNLFSDHVRQARQEEDADKEANDGVLEKE